MFAPGFSIDVMVKVACNSCDFSGVDKSCLCDDAYVYIAHKISKIRRADMKYVMNKGRIVEGGRHKSLMRIKRKCYELHQKTE